MRKLLCRGQIESSTTNDDEEMIWEKCLEFFFVRGIHLELWQCQFMLALVQTIMTTRNDNDDDHVAVDGPNDGRNNGD